MAAYKYIKEYQKHEMRRSMLISFFLLGLGGIMLAWVGWPIFSFHLFSAPFLVSVVSPIAERSRPNESSSDFVYAAGKEKATSAIDYTNANVWFPQKPQKRVTTSVNIYTLTIPKLLIKNAIVTIGGNDLSKSLIHYGGTAFPGQKGNAAIFGHSVLPQFFNSKNYKTIFSTLPTLVNGDDIYLTYDGVTYRYKVEEMAVKDPTDLSVLEQQYDDSYTTLVTCVPPGTYWQRLNVRARLIKY